MGRLKKEQLKKEGKYLTKKQKEDQARAHAQLEAMRAQGMDVPEAGVKKAPRPGTRIRNKAKSATPESDSTKEDSPPKQIEKIEEAPKAKPEVKEPEKEEVKASWEDSDEDVAESWDAEPEKDAPTSNGIQEPSST